MGKYIPVEPEKWAAMVQAQADLVRYKEMCDELDSECTHLKAEVDRLAECEGYHYTAIAISMLKEQLQQKNIDYVEARKANEAKVEMIKSLKAEVERLTAFTTRTIIPNEELQAQVERLTKQIAGLIVSLQKSHDEHGEALYKLKYKNERKTSRKKRSS